MLHPTVNFQFESYKALFLLFLIYDRVAELYYSKNKYDMQEGYNVNKPSKCITMISVTCI